MKWVNLSLLIIWLAVIALGVYWSWQGFNNATILNRGGFLYDDNGKVIGLWDGWDKANYSHWYLVFYLPLKLLIGMPIWWMVVYWSIGAWLVFYYILPYIMTSGKQHQDS